jgi:hypothetical protein
MALRNARTLSVVQKAVWRNPQFCFSLETNKQTQHTEWPSVVQTHTLKNCLWLRLQTHTYNMLKKCLSAFKHRHDMLSNSQGSVFKCTDTACSIIVYSSALKTRATHSVTAQDSTFKHTDLTHSVSVYDSACKPIPYPAMCGPINLGTYSPHYIQDIRFKTGDINISLLSLLINITLLKHD